MSMTENSMGSSLIRGGGEWRTGVGGGDKEMKLWVEVN
jgi:hypothetical protein